MAAEPSFFATEADFRRWLAAHHDTADELLAGFWKKAAGKPSIDWPQARDQALCFGWIDGVRKSRDDESYTVRFTPRRGGSAWSQVNVGRYEALKAAGRMTPAGERAFAENPRRYAHQEGAVAAGLTAAEEALLRRERKAWAHWQKTAPSYRRNVTRWVTEAKKPETRERRLAKLIEDCAAGRKVGVLE